MTTDNYILDCFVPRKDDVLTVIASPQARQSRIEVHFQLILATVQSVQRGSLDIWTLGTDTIKPKYFL